MQPVRMGIIGCGVIGQAHLRSADNSPLIEVVAVADLIEERRLKAAREHGIPRIFAHGNALLDDQEVEAVVLAIPAGDRIEMPMRALQNGKHLLIEKPVAMHADLVRQWLAVKGDRVAGCCSSRFHFLNATRAARDFIATGALGQLRTVHARNLWAAGPRPATTPPEWWLARARNGGGILMNWGCYDLDYLLFITGEQLKPHTVLASAWGVPPQLLANAAPGSDAESHYAAFIRCADGIAITFERGEYMPVRTEASWQAIGTNGSLQLKMTSGGGQQLVFDEATAENGLVSHVVWEGSDDEMTVHDAPIRDFAAAIREGRQPSTSLARALLIQMISDAIYASAESGRAVELAWEKLTCSE